MSNDIPIKFACSVPWDGCAKARTQRGETARASSIPTRNAQNSHRPAHKCAEILFALMKQGIINRKDVLMTEQLDPSDFTRAARLLKRAGIIRRCQASVGKSNIEASYELTGKPLGKAASVGQRVHPALEAVSFQELTKAWQGNDR